MDYKEKYEAALEKIKGYVTDQFGCTRLKPSDIFPELAESEDERIRKSIILLLQRGGYMSPEDKDKAYAWLEKQKEQKPVEWSEEEIVNWLKENFYVSSFDNTKIVTKFSSMDDLIKSVRKRLKSLRPQPHWKPSEEQMASLDYVLKAYESTEIHMYEGAAKQIRSLYEQLKKL